MDRYITPILYPVNYIDAYGEEEEEEEWYEYPREIAMKPEEPPLTPLSDDLSWTEQTAPAFSGCYPPLDYSSDGDDLTATDPAEL